MDEKVMQVKLPEGAKYLKVEVTEDGTVKIFYTGKFDSTIEKVVQKPMEEQLFEVNPEAINQKLFENEREDVNQEIVRKLILEAFKQMENNPMKYKKVFYTFIPKKTWDSKTVVGLSKIVTIWGDHMANWIEQALEWAQRIDNGESWEDVCNNPDTSTWHRAIVWKNGYIRIVGSSKFANNPKSTSYIDRYDRVSGALLTRTVPLIVRYK